MRTMAVFIGLIATSIVMARAEKPVAVVNGESIPRSELEAVLKVRPQALLPLTATQTRQIHEDVVSMLIDEALMRQFLAKNAPTIDPSEVDKQLKNLAASLKSKNKSMADYCKETLQTERQVRVGIEVMLRWNAFTDKKLNDAELQKYFTQNKDYFDKVTVKCHHIVMRVPSDTPQAEKAEVEKKIRELRQKLVTGQITFTDAARKFSHCSSATKAGSLGYIHRKWMVEEPFAQAAFALKLHEISEPVWTESGVHLILVTDRKPPEPSDFTKIKAEVRECCSEEMRLNMLQELRKTAKIEINLP